MRTAKSVAALTGAGISRESEIPTFRDEDGLWTRYDVDDVATPEAFARDPQGVWAFHDMLRETMASARPNPAHMVLAKMEERYPAFTIITQNIDGLHQAAGSKDVVELHGNGWRFRCTSCERRWNDRQVPLVSMPPLCRCGAMARPDVVWFGEPLPVEALERSLNAVASCDVLLVVGTSATVQPAASLPWAAKEGGALVFEFNKDITPVTAFADGAFTGLAGEVMPPLWGEVFGDGGALKM
jgi:NAD-dependent deacetylase